MKPSIKKPVNVRISNDLIIESRAYNINLSRALEEKLTELLQEHRSQAWIKENAEAIESYNNHIEKNGVFGNKLRRF